METLDYTDATTEERYKALDELLFQQFTGRQPGEKRESIYSFTFNKTREEHFPFSTRKERMECKQKTNYRQYYNVLISNHSSGITESFEFFCPHKIHYGHGINADRGQLESTPQPLKPEDKQDRLLGFLSCIVSDFSVIEHQGIKDGFELMKEFGYEDPFEARNTFSALLLNHQKVERVFDKDVWEQLEKIIEGY